VIKQILIFLLFFALQLNAGTSGRWRSYLENDFQQLKSRVNFQTALIAGGWLGGMYLLSTYDEELNSSVKSIYKGNWQKYFDTIDHLGNVPYTLPITFGLTGLTLLGNDKKLQDAAFTSSEALVATGVITTIFKLFVGRSRPDEGNGARFFKPFSRYVSFPSGHSASAFAIITPLVYYYPGPLTYMLLLFPASTAISRMALNRHWFTDVLTGSVIGVLVGVTLAKWHQDLAVEKGFYDPLETPPMLISYSFNF